MIQGISCFFLSQLTRHCDCIALKISKPFNGNANIWKHPHVFQDLFIDANKSLLVIGSKGVLPSHINSLVELLAAHSFVRIKLASDKLDLNSILETILSDPRMLNHQLLQLRGVELVFGRALS
jgi:RNA-binding protein YhbY